MVGRYPISTLSKTLVCASLFASGDDLKELIREKYPELTNLLICMWGKESSFGKFLIGDRGKAIGHFQIWISKHPVSYNCAMDFECSLDYTAKMIKKGKGNLWTSYKGCLTEYPVKVDQQNKI